MEFFEQVGKIAIGSRLRMLTEKITTDASQLYKLYGSDIKPKWFPVYYVLSNQECMTITEIAQTIGHSHPSVSKIINEMTRKGLIESQCNQADKRKTVVALSAAGRALQTKLHLQYEHVDQAIEELLAASQHNLWEAIGEWEYLLEQKSFLQRVKDVKKKDESRQVTIVDYSDQYEEAFRTLNREWIEKYFIMERADHEVLDDPKGYILDKGGHIFVALYHGEPIGVCAMIKMHDPEYDYELAKMAVSPAAQGKGVGWLLGQAIIGRAIDINAKNLYLESNTKLTPAIKLYEKMGFRKISGRNSPYERSNIQMKLSLNPLLHD